MGTRTLVISCLGLLGLTASGGYGASSQLHVRYETGRTGDRVCLASPLSQWSPDEICLTEVSEGVYERLLPEPWLPTLPYKFVVNGEWRLDPKNPRREPDGFGGWNSVWGLSFQDDPALTPPSGWVPAWASVNLKDWEGAPAEGIQVLTSGPSGQRDRTTPRKWIYLLDGGDFLREGAGAVFAHLASELGVEIIATFLTPKERLREYGLNLSYARWMAESVVPAVEAAVGGVPGRAEDRLIVGASLGGLAAVFQGLKFPGVFGNVASLSGALWWEESRIFSEVKPVPVRFYLDAGLFEGRGILESNRRMNALMKTQGQGLVFREFPSLHNWMAWRNRLPLVLRDFFQRPDSRL